MRVREPDEVCAQAVDLAQAAAVGMSSPAQVGEHVGLEVEADRVVSHLFACLDPAYRGWRWAVTVTRAARAKNVTVSETALIPGPEAILAPDWIPWRERLRPGDLGVGDLMPAPADDERLVPAAALEGEEGLPDWDETTDVAAGLSGPPVAAPAPEERLVPAQARVMSAIGRDDAAVRWYSGEHGPTSAIAHAAPGRCEGCGFFTRMGGPLGRLFGVCANAYAPDDGRVVSQDHGCGAHSEALSGHNAPGATQPVIDELGYDLVDRPGVSVEETDFEPLAGG